ncbi:MAG: ABC transporter permease [Roseibacillus sp.]|jgi:putative ABC transport system permease protein
MSGETSAMIEMFLAHSETQIKIPLLQLALSLVPLIVVGWISFRWAGKGGEIGIATARMVVQLLAVGYVLVFLFKVKNPWVGLAVVTFMIAVSSWIAIRTVKKLRWQAYGDALLGIGLGGGAVFALVLVGVLGLDPWYQARYVIPIAGMIFSNAMTAVTLSAERFESELKGGRKVDEARKVAWNAALIPQVNSFLAVGLVSLPGMMTGQILAGTSPLDAVRYQVMVMAMIMGSAGMAVAVFLVRRVKREQAPGGE